MKSPVLLSVLLLLSPAVAPAENVVRQTLDIENSASPRVACQNPKFNFSRQEVEVCLNVYQGCLRPGSRQSEREECLIAAVRKGMAAQGSAAAPKGQGTPAAKTVTIDFSFNPFQTVDLIEICEQKQNKNRPLCAGAILPNKARIVQDINKARQ